MRVCRLRNRLREWIDAHSGRLSGKLYESLNKILLVSSREIASSFRETYFKLSRVELRKFVSRQVRYFSRQHVALEIISISQTNHKQYLTHPLVLEHLEELLDALIASL